MALRKIRWKPVPGFEGYEVSEMGKVRSVSRTFTRSNGTSYTLAGRILRTQKHSQDYLQVSLRSNGKTYTRLVHQLVLEAFVGPRDDGMDSCHRDGDKTNNRLRNLRWDTRSENMLDGRRRRAA